MKTTIMPCALSGSVLIPPSKSAAHRAIIAAALADGRSTIRNIDLSNDMHATINACRTLGSRIGITQDTRCTLTIDGAMQHNQSVQIDCGESGSTLRFMIPVAGALGGSITFTGSGRLPQRPIDAYIRIFHEQCLPYSQPSDANLPLTINGKLHGGDFALDGNVSSQYVTGLLFALPLLDEDSHIHIYGGLESRGYVDMTLSMLRLFGIQIDAHNDCFSIPGKQRYATQDITIEGDYSQAAFFLVGGAINGQVRVGGLLNSSLQPDSVIVPLLERMGADITRDGDVLIANKSILHGIEIDISQCPDLAPPLAVAAAYAQGETRIIGAARLRIKECDRLSALAHNLNKLGIKADETADSLTITGGCIGGGEVDAFGDHRIAMAFAIAATGAQACITVCGAQHVEKSYPDFFNDFRSLGGKTI